VAYTLSTPTYITQLSLEYTVSEAIVEIYCHSLQKSLSCRNTVEHGLAANSLGVEGKASVAISVLGLSDKLSERKLQACWVGGRAAS